MVQDNVIRVQMIGTLQVFVNRKRILHFGTAKVQALLAYLLLERGKPHERSMLSNLFWPDQDERSARNSLRQALYRLRQACPLEDALHMTRQTIHMQRDARIWSDVTTFSGALQQCHQHEHGAEHLCAECCARLEDVVTFHRGSFLAGLSLGDCAAFETWVTLQRAWLDKLMSHALTVLVQHFEQLGDFDKMSHYAERWFTHDELSEVAHRALMRGLALRGMRGQALAHFERCREVLASELGVLPSVETEALYQEIRSGDFGLLSPVERLHSNPVALEVRPRVARSATLPQLPMALAPPIGRNDEIARIATLLSDPLVRLVSITGMAGCGKTTVAQAAAHSTLSHFDGEIYWISSGDVEWETIANAIETRPTSAVRNENQLLVLDGCETLADSTLPSRITLLLAASPNLTILTTGSSRISIAGEWVIQLSGFEHLADAVALFIRKGQQPNGVDEGERRLIERLCEAVDRHPSAIEMLASWLRLYDGAQLVEMVKERGLSWIAHAHSNRGSLASLAERMWLTLSTESRTLAVAVASFAGSFSAKTFEAITGYAPISLLSLLDTAWLEQTEDGKRYRVPSILGWFLQEQGKGSAEFKRNAREHYAKWLADCGQSLSGQNQPDTVGQIESDWLMIEQVWSWAIEAEDRDFIDHAAPAIAAFCSITGQPNMGAAMISDGLSATGRDDVRLDADLTLLRADMMFEMGNKESAYHLLTQLLTLVRAPQKRQQVQCKLAHVTAAIGDLTNLKPLLGRLTHIGATGAATHRAQAQNALGHLFELQGARGQAHAHFQTALGIMRQLGDWYGIGRCYHSLGRLAQAASDMPLAKHYFEESLRIQTQLLDRRRPIFVHRRLGQIAQAMGDRKSAETHYQESLQLAEAVANWPAAANAYRRLGQLAFLNHDIATAFNRWYAGLKLSTQNQLHREAESLLYEMSQTLELVRKNGQYRYIQKSQSSSDLKLSDMLSQFWMLQYQRQHTGDQESSNVVTREDISRLVLQSL